MRFHAALLSLALALSATSAEAARLEDRVVEAVSAAAAELPGRIEAVEVIRVPRGFPAGDDVVTGFRPGERFSGLVLVSLATTGAGAPRKAWATARVKRVVTIVQPTRRIERGELLTPDSLTLADLDASRVPPGALTDVADALGQMARARLRPGYALSPLQIEPPQVVRRGDQIQLIARHGPLLITAPGRVEARSGAIGEMVSMTNLRSKKRLQARIVDDHTAEVELFHGP